MSGLIRGAPSLTAGYPQDRLAGIASSAHAARMLPDDVIQLCRAAPGEVVLLRELERAGHDRRRVAEWARAGSLDRLLQGSYVEAGRPAPRSRPLHLPLRYLEQRRPDHHPPPVITGAAALRWDGYADVPPPPLPSLLVHAACRARADHLPFRMLHVPTEELACRLVGDVPLADVGRCIADAALDPAVTDLMLRLLVDDARCRRRANMPALARRWRRIRHAGADRLLAMVDAGVFEQESEGERRAFRELFLPHPPLPDCQVVYGRRRVDFVFIAAGLVIEYHGGVHDRSVDDDAVRVHELEGLGLRVKVVTRSLLRVAPQVAADIHDLRRRREQLVRSGALVLPPLPVQPERLTPLRTLTPLG